jgi:hypothetical protein
VGSTVNYYTTWEGSEANTSVSSVLVTMNVTRRDEFDWQPRLVMFGDLGWTDDQVLPYLQQESEAGVIDAMVIFGDMVYWVSDAVTTIE